MAAMWAPAASRLPRTPAPLSTSAFLAGRSRATLPHPQGFSRRHRQATATARRTASFGLAPARAASWRLGKHYPIRELRPSAESDSSTVSAEQQQLRRRRRQHNREQSWLHPRLAMSACAAPRPAPADRARDVRRIRSPAPTTTTTTTTTTAAAAAAALSTCAAADGSSAGAAEATGAAEERGNGALPGAALSKFRQSKPLSGDLSKESAEPSSAASTRTIGAVSAATLLVAAAAAAAALLQLLSPGAALALGSEVAAGGAPTAAAGSVATSKLGQAVAAALRGRGWADEAVVVTVAMLPVLELRGALPIGLWMGMSSLKASVLAVIGNMIPIPFILLLLGPLTSAVASTSEGTRRALEWVLETTRKKAGPIAEFQWLGLMLFVAVPLPGTGAWSGAIAAHLLGMPFAAAFWANLCGVAIAAAIVSAVCLLPARDALLLAAALMAASAFMWSGLRWARRRGLLPGGDGGGGGGGSGVGGVGGVGGGDR